jgi:hypothetical protein
LKIWQTLTKKPGKPIQAILEVTHFRTQRVVLSEGDNGMDCHWLSLHRLPLTVNALDLHRNIAVVGITFFAAAQLTIGLAPTLWGWPVWGEEWVFSVISDITFSYVTRFWG